MFFTAVKKAKAFTLAEVLITLGIIGIVAAMTMPVLIAKNEQKSTITRLQRTYNIISNALVRAQVDYGDTSNWSFQGAGAEYDGSEESANLLNDAIENVVKKYIVSYLAGGYKYDTRRITADKRGYVTPISLRDGTKVVTYTSNVPLLILNDGTWVFFSRHLFGGNTNPDGSVEPRLNYGIRLLVDLNGPKLPNIVGKDCYVMTMAFSKNSRLIFYRKVIYQPATNNLKLPEMDYDETVEECETKGTYCGFLIQQDGWQIKYKF